MKNNISRLGLVLFLIAVMLLAVSFSASAQTAIEDTRNSVIRIIVFESATGAYLGAGSGFVIGDEEPFEFVATCAHVVDFSDMGLGQGDIDIFVWRSRDDTIEATIHVFLGNADIALLRLDPQHLLHGYEPLELARREMVSIGDPVYAVGFPAAADWVLGDFPAAYPEDATVTGGIIGKFTTFMGAAFHQMDATVSWGNSGGPLVNEHGQVIGVVSRGAVLEGIYGAVQIDYLTDVLVARGIDFKPAFDVADDPEIPRAIDEVNFMAMPPSVESGEELNLQARVTNHGDEQRDLIVSFFVDDALIAQETAFQVEPGQNETVSTPWSTDAAGDYQLRVTSGDASSEHALVVESAGLLPAGIDPLIIGLGAAALILILLAIVLVMRSRKPAPAAAPAAPTPSPQQATVASGPVTRTKPEGFPGAPPGVTQARRQVPRPVIKGISGYFASQTLELVENQLIIGRDPRMAQLVYPQQREEISRKHVTIRFDEKTHKFNLTDSSSNGTFLSSNQKLEPGEAYYLNSGDRFYLAEPNEVFEVKVES